MPQHHLHEPHIGFVLQHQRRHRVPEQVTRSALVYPRSLDVVRHHQPQAARPDAVSRHRQEQHAFIRRQRELRAHFVQVLPDPRQRARPELSQLLTLSFDELMGKNVPRRGSKRGPMSRLQQQIIAIEQLPKAKQQFVSQMLDTVLAQAQQ